MSGTVYSYFHRKQLKEHDALDWFASDKRRKRSVVVCSLSPDWEPFGDLTVVYDHRTTLPRDRELTAFFGRGLVRVTVPAAAAPLVFRDLSKALRMKPGIVSKLWRIGANNGSDPGRWRFGLKPVPKRDWLATEMWSDIKQRWVPCSGEDLADPDPLIRIPALIDYDFRARDQAMYINNHHLCLRDEVESSVYWLVFSCSGFDLSNQESLSDPQQIADALIAGGVDLPERCVCWAPGFFFSPHDVGEVRVLVSEGPPDGTVVVQPGDGDTPSVVVPRVNLKKLDRGIKRKTDSVRVNEIRHRLTNYEKAVSRVSPDEYHVFKNKTLDSIALANPELTMACRRQKMELD